jgi:hypothetical protein
MSNKKEKTALDYYSKKIGKLMMYAITGSITGKQFSMLEIKLFQESKEMEKERMVEFAKNSFDYLLDNNEDCILLTTQDRIEHFYNETYGGKK